MFYLLIFALIVVDLVSKWLFSSILGTRTIHLIGDALSLKIVHNTGIAFSFPIEGLILKLLTAGLIVLIIVYYFRYEPHKKSRLVRSSYALILGGAIANGSDRIIHGSVVDFIAVKYFAIFNFADIFISIGALLLFFYYYSHERKAREHQ